MCRSTLVWAMLVMAALSVSCSTPGNSAAVEGTKPKPGQAAAAIEPQAEQILRSMSDTLGSAKAFGFHVSAQVDEMSPGGKMVQTCRDTTVLVRRPDAIFAQAQCGDDLWTLCYKGKKLTMHRKDLNQYTTIDTPETIDKTLDFLYEKHGLSLPLADLLLQDPYQALTEKAQSGVYLGQHLAGDRSCHHLLFTQENVDWQIWIDAGEKHLPMKLVITHKTQPGQPQYVAELGNWNLTPAATDSAFDFKVPAGAKAVEMPELRNEKGQ